MQNKAAARAKMGDLLRKLQHWMKGGYAAFHLLPDSLRQLHASAPTWSVGEDSNHGVHALQPPRP